MAKEPKETEAVEGAPGKLAFLENKVVLLGTIVVVQALLAFGLTQFVIVPRLGVQESGASPRAQGATAEAAPDVGVLVGLEEIIVTLQSDEKLPRYLRTTVTVEVENQELADLVAARLPLLRDTVIMILSAKTPAEIQRPEGKQALRDELFRRLGEKLPPDALRNIYFSDLVIQ
jgi:flagellar FliL protein